MNTRDPVNHGQPDPLGGKDPKPRTAVVRTLLPVLPLYVLVPIAFAVVFWAAGFPLHWGLFGLGALGWWVAYLLRMPVLLVMSKRNSGQQPKAIVYFSGPFEEGVRLVALLVFGASMSHALSIGQGWAAIEVAFAIVQGIAVTSLKFRTDEKAMRAKAAMAEIGIPTDGSALWGVVERLFASAFHIGATLVIAWDPWLVIVMMPVHTLFNVTVLRTMKKSIAVAESVVAVFGSVVLAAGLLLHLVP